MMVVEVEMVVIVMVMVMVVVVRVDLRSSQKVSIQSLAAPPRSRLLHFLLLIFPVIHLLAHFLFPPLLSHQDTHAHQ